ncbi:MAG: glycosyl hydrolase family 65 protein [Clostridia bacterium]
MKCDSLKWQRYEVSGNGKINVRPKLPKKWSRLVFNLIVGGEKYSIYITHNNQKIMKL